jgi:hypothetical protein
MNPLASRRFLTLLLDTIVSVFLHFYAGDDVNFLIAAIQPIFVFLIISYTVEGSLRIRQGLSWRE